MAALAANILDPINALAAAWSRQPPPPPAGEGGELNAPRRRRIFTRFGFTRRYIFVILNRI